jgi:hypothetical protein
MRLMQSDTRDYLGASRICQFTFFTPLNPPDVLGGNHSYSLPLLRGGLGWGLLFMQKRDAPDYLELIAAFRNWVKSEIPF